MPVHWDLPCGQQGEKQVCVVKSKKLGIELIKAISMSR